MDAPNDETFFWPAAGFPAVPVAGPVLPLSQFRVASPERPVDAEPTACSNAEPTACMQPPPPKLRRLHSKTTVPLDVCPKATEPAGHWANEVFSYTEEFVTQHFFRQLNSDQQYNWVYERLRAFYVKEVHARTLTQEERSTWRRLYGSERQKDGRRAFRELDAQDRIALATVWRKATAPPPYIGRVVEERLINQQWSGRTGKGAGAKGALLTWMLPPTILDVSNVVQDGEPTALREVVRRLRTTAVVQSFWQEIQEHAHRCRRSAGGQDVAICLEVCPDTWESRRDIQLHVHAFLKTGGASLAVRNLSLFEFHHVRPHLSLTVGGLQVGTNGRTSWSGFFYCCIHDKVGTVFTETTKLPFTGFLVQPTWILNLVQSQKLEQDVARVLLVQCANASRHIKELELHEMHLEQEAVRIAQAEAYRLLGIILKSQQVYPEAEAFVKQFETPLHRYQFLVLSGPSKVGKTAFARSLCDSGLETLELNCASGAEPDLRAYRLRKHGLILFDEIVAQQVVAQRKLFQAQSARVQLGCSATNCHSYDVFVWRTKMVLASNNWESSLAELSDSDQAWVVANSIVLQVNEPMWQE